MRSHKILKTLVDMREWISVLAVIFVVTGVMATIIITINNHKQEVRRNAYHRVEQRCGKVNRYQFGDKFSELSTTSLNKKSLEWIRRDCGGY